GEYRCSVGVGGGVACFPAPAGRFCSWGGLFHGFRRLCATTPPVATGLRRRRGEDALTRERVGGTSTKATAGLASSGTYCRHVDDRTMLAFPASMPPQEREGGLSPVSSCGG